MNYSAEVPVRMILKGARRQLNYNVKELSEDELKALWEKEGSETAYEYFAKEHKYSYCSLEMGGARWNYHGIVEEIIRAKYTSEQMEAITNNMNVIVAEFFDTLVTSGLTESVKYLLTSVKSDNMENFKTMQEWRTLAKKEAKSVLKME